MSLLAALKKQSQPLATATPAIAATRRGESGGGIARIARIARIAVAAELKQENESPNEVYFSAWPFPILEDEQQPLAIAIPAIPATREQPHIDENHVAHGGTSCVFRTRLGVQEYVRLIDEGEPPGQAFSAACDLEDASL